MVNGASLANKTAVDRQKTDFYPTPENVTIALMDFLNLQKGTEIWEPACGEGDMSTVLEKLGYNVCSSELHDRGYGNIGVDFLNAEIPKECEWIITNPPFSLAENFIRRAIEFKIPFAMLLKSQYWHSSKRRILFEEYKPQYVLPLTWRPDFLFGAKSGSPTMECVWTVWDSSPAEYTVYQPIKKPMCKAKE